MSDIPSWKGKTVLVTGASMGIGESVARAFAARGADLILAARGAERLKKLQDEFSKTGSRCEIVACDLTKPGDVKVLCERALSRPRLDAVVHNAGAILYEYFSDMREEDWRGLFELNFFSVLSLTRGLLPLLEASKASLALVSSAAAWRALPMWSAYCASKAALTSWGEALRMELKAKGIRVVTVYPGVTKTGLSAHSSSQGPKPFATSDAKATLPEKVAEAIVRACEKGKRDEPVIVFNRFYRWLTFLFPKLFDAYFASLYRKKGWL